MTPTDTFLTQVHPYTVIGYSTVGTLERYCTTMNIAKKSYNEYKQWANIVELIDNSDTKVLERWESEV